MRPLFARAVAEHEALMAEAGATGYLRKNGWLKVYRSDASFAATARERDVAAQFGLPFEGLDRDGTHALEPDLAPVFRHAVYWQDVASVTNPLAVTRAYAARFAALGGLVLKGDARSLHRADGRWRVETAEGPVDAADAVLALGPWTPDVLGPLGLDCRSPSSAAITGTSVRAAMAALTRPVVDAEVGYCVAPMEQGLRLTTGAEFAPRDAPPTPVQFDRLLPRARALFPLGEPIEPEPWMGSRPCFADSRPVIGRAPGQRGLWLAYGHAHWGLTLGPVTGRLVAEMMTGGRRSAIRRPTAPSASSGEILWSFQASRARRGVHASPQQ